MSQYYGAPHGQGVGYRSSPPVGAGAQNLQFYPSQYSQPVSGHATPSQASYGYGGPSSSSGGGGGGGGYGMSGGGGGFGGGGFGVGAGIGASGVGGVSGRMGEQGGLRTGWLAAFSTEGYDGEPPLLEELGVNFGHIQTKTLAVLNPFTRIDQHLMDDSDLAGPVLFFLLFGTFLLFSGKLHFGYIYGLALVGSVLLHVVLSLMSPDDGAPQGAAVGAGAYANTAPSYPGQPTTDHHQQLHGGHLSSTLTMARSASVLGYCLLPLVATSLVGIVMPMDTPVGIIMTTAAIMWCTYSASGMFCAVGRMRGMRGLVAYPLALFYVGFGIMGVFSSRGSGSLAKVAAGGLS
ncbi:hypothetical protein QBC46DRAFT_403406 [Diplogelasinospora grovesii]|uniref:Protein YIP n=1 Tax=Diplogelasinospora grovesii TaxID=303347 RepID=A0AAN6NH71_9PEZI|nr:hypothetical protein QBC46DRAFT_403406 [Diplogelasinospora grovesii]